MSHAKEYTFTSEAMKQKKHGDGSGETAIWTDGLSVTSCDSRQDNFTPVMLVAGKKYRVTVKIEEVENEET